MSGRGRKDTSKQHQATVAHMAQSAFAAHVLRWDAKNGCWHCRAPSTSFYAFSLYIGPSVVMLWGDICETVLRFNDPRPLSWLLSSPSMDYVLGKIVAINEGKEEFFPGDVDVYLDDMIKQYPVKDDEGERDTVNEEHVANLERARTLFDEYFDDGESWAMPHAWHRAWDEAIGDGDTPDMMSWSSGALWFWHAIETFRRLYDQGRQVGAGITHMFTVWSTL